MALMPVEIIEKILIKCDGKTLLNSILVSDEWSDIIKYLSNTTAIWRWCCMEEIPKNELNQYLQNYNEDNSKMWYYIYKNWTIWQNIADIRFEIVLSPADIPKISSIDVFDDYIAVGSEDGRVRVYNQYWHLLHLFRIQIEKVTKVRFLYTPNHAKSAPKLLISHAKRLIVCDLFCDGVEFFTIDNVQDFSHFKNFILYHEQNNHFTIEKLNINAQDIDSVLEKCCTMRGHYTLENLNSFRMLDEICTIIVSNQVQQFRYNKEPMRRFTLEDFCPQVIVKNISIPPNTAPSIQKYFVLQDNVIIILHKDSLTYLLNEYIEVIILNEGDAFSRKLLNTSETFKAAVTCIYLFGNTLIFGLDSGNIFVYHVPSWRHFRITDFYRKVIIGKHPILNVLVQETKDKRKIFVTTRFNIHEVIGFSSPDLLT